MIYYFGDGSDGALNVASGTQNLPLNQIHQFTNVTIAAGATLGTASTTGSVLFIAVQDTFTLNGTINVSGKVNPGSADWSFTVDGVTYSSPGVAVGSYYSDHGPANFGFGSGGAGGGFSGGPLGGSGGSGGYGISGGAGVGQSRNSNGTFSMNGNAGSNSGGGSGSSAIRINKDSTRFLTVTSNSGRGGISYGESGADGSGSVIDQGGTGGVSGYWGSNGGGGAGGIAGRAGVHIVIRARKVVLNGTIITSGSAGGNGGNGGRLIQQSGAIDYWGSPGLGGGGGSGGNISIFYADTLTNTAAKFVNGGSGGAAGYGNTGFVQPVSQGGSGFPGTFTSKKLTPAEYASSISVDSTNSQVAYGSPTLTAGAVTVTPTSAASGYAAGPPLITMNIWDVGNSASVTGYGSPTITQGPPPPPPPVNWEDLGVENTKEYVAKVYSKTGQFMRVLTDITDDLTFSQQILTPGTTTTIRLARSAENTIELREPLTDQAGVGYTDQTSDPYVVTSTTANTVGPDTDIEIGLGVDIFAHYGGYEPLVNEKGEPYVDQDGDPYIVSTGAPMGRRIFSGKIMKYRAHYGDTEYVEATLISHGVELTKGELIKSGAATTVTYPSTEIATIAKSVLDTNPGRIGYTTGSIDTTGVTPTMKFELNTKLEGIKSLYSQTPDGYFWYVDVGENLLYIKKRNTAADHIFVKGKHLADIDIEKSAEDLRNKVYFVGGDPGSGTLFKVYTDTAAITDSELGVHRITDRRFTLTASAQRYASKVMSEYGRPIWTSTITIPSSVYDIESIKLGQMVGFRNFGNFVDTQLLQIVGYNYTSTLITLTLGTLQEGMAEIIADLDEGLSNEQYQQLPTTPS
ncbi:phage tail protein [Rhodococcus qingshengii]|uniref:hypothetical protein n=1 Tax=Rhodococcus TaxID=1827 RepID=UPI0013DE0157|nr:MULTISPECIES: hypothetical protein [Rhodococcus]BDQ20082.1 phage tail protein [Rhodococcus qingshengii]